MVACLWIVNVRQPDVLFAEGGHAVAVRMADGRLTIRKTGSDGFAVREWLAADGDTRAPGDPVLAAGFACDPIGCIARLKDGALVSLVLAAEAFEEDCARAKIVVSAREAPPFCAAAVIDRQNRGGAQALYRTPTGFVTVAARPKDQDRPWARPAPQAASTGTAAPAASAPTTRDATPRADDLAPDD